MACVGADFLSFLNRGLDCYENVPQVFSVTGFNFPIAVPAYYPTTPMPRYEAVPGDGQPGEIGGRRPNGRSPSLTICFPLRKAGGESIRRARIWRRCWP